jgi:uncharacterized protein (TIGR02001 family)
MNSRLHRFSGFAALALAGAVLASPAVADGMRGSMKDTPKKEERCKLTANVDIATEYVFRGFSQTAQGPAIQGGFDATCGLFYAGVWASNLDWGTNIAGASSAASIEMDWYAGIKPVTGRITWDLGVIYYTYPNSSTPNYVGVTGLDANYVEIKVGASMEVWKDATLASTLFYSPNGQWEVGGVLTSETQLTQNLRKFSMFGREWSPSVSALIGYQKGMDNDYKTLAIANGDDHYYYWNVGLTLGFAEKWSIDVRYWDTSLGSGTFCEGNNFNVFQCDSRVVGTLKFAY